MFNTETFIFALTCLSESMSTREDYTEDVVLSRQGSRKLNGLARGDSVKRLPQLGRLGNREKGSAAANGNLQPNTPYEKLRAWMINEGKY